MTNQKQRPSNNNNYYNKFSEHLKVQIQQIYFALNCFALHGFALQDFALYVRDYELFS